MKNKNWLIILLVYTYSFVAAKPTTIQKQITSANDIVYYDAFLFEIEGKYHDEKNYNRLASGYEKIVRPEVWGLSKNSAGISVRFSTNSTSINVKWKVNGSPSINHMNKIGVGGVDLYCFMNGQWQYVSSGIPSGSVNSLSMISNMDTTTKEFLVNLPLYSTVESVEIGADKNAIISKPIKNLLKNQKPIVFYGTSITQGGSASRPGMAYPAIISRNYSVETINLGFSGNGRFERSVGLALCDIDAAMYVIDCTPNSFPDTIKKNALSLIKQLRACKPDAPILLVESILRENSFLNKAESTTAGSLKWIEAQNKELKKAFEDSKELGIEKVYYLEATNLLGTDHEGTVDGTHLTDLGFFRIADVIGKKIKKIAKLK